MHRSLTSFSPPAEADYRGVTVTPVLEPEVRVECWLRTSVPAHPKGCCCGVYKGTTSHKTPRTPQRKLLSGLQRYYLSQDTPHTPKEAAVGITKVLPLPTHPAHPKGCCCRVYKGTTSHKTPRTPQRKLLWGLQRYYLSQDTPHTPKEAAVGFTKVLPLTRHPAHPKGSCCGVYKGTTSHKTPRTPQRKLLSGLQRYYLSQDTPHTPKEAAVGFTKVLPLTRHPVHPKGCCCRVYKGTTSHKTPRTPQRKLLWGLQRYYLSQDTPFIPRDAAVGFTKVLPLTRHPAHPKGSCCRVYKGTTSHKTPRTPQRKLLSGLQRYYLSPHTPPIPRDAAVGFTKVLPLTRHLTHPKGSCCGVYKGTTSHKTPRTPQRKLLWGLQRYYLSQDTPHTPKEAAVGFTKVLPLTRHPAHPKGSCCGVYKGTTSHKTPRTPQGMLLWGLQRYYLSQDTSHTPRDAAVGFTKVLPLTRHPTHSAFSIQVWQHV